MNKTILASLFSLSFGIVSTTALAEKALQATDTQKAVVIVFNPPKGMEKEFLDSFAKDQAINFAAHSDPEQKKTESINLIPTKLGEPLIHITILKDKTMLEDTYKSFGPKENRGAYVGKHSEKYGDLKIPKVYLQNSQSYFADVVK
ncbi:hypothetical protein [Pseudomonas sp. Irchel 3E19]|uniref:hypothetical protein n=1 Tax=Pseudomonas sp. Irchel 3E19 TaxID=2008981 RepID=UPI000BA48F17|nr:hypothetical protein [Pseudomonas sp. Irchel 3E19]